jgi:hypothetical protein
MPGVDVIRGFPYFSLCWKNKLECFPRNFLALLTIKAGLGN